MADEHELRHINWMEVFSFTHIFKSWKMSMHMSKLALALAAIVLVFCFGWAMDKVWSWGNSYVYPGEISDHYTKPGETFDRDKKAFEDTRLDAAATLKRNTMMQQHSLADFVVKLSDNSDLQSAFMDVVRKTNDSAKDYKTPESVSQMVKEAQDNRQSWASVLGQAEKTFDQELTRIDDALDQAKAIASKNIQQMAIKPNEKADRQKELDKACERAPVAQTQLRAQFYADVNKIKGQGIFASLRKYEVSWAEDALRAAGRGNIMGGLTEYAARADMKRAQMPAAAPVADRQGAVPALAVAPDNAPGFLCCLLMCVQGFCWLIGEHWLYAAVLLAFGLAVWALFGGAIYRIAALHAARDEKISLVQAMKFSIDKFASFVTAPLLPLGIILVIGLVLTVMGFAAGTWGGGIVLGIVFLLCLVLGFAVAFLMTGLVGGGALMYPTIAVEGSDSFDAISRSFSYVLSRPWRSGLYGLVALAYGTITYLFVRLFVFVALSATHMFLKWGVCTGGQTLGPDADKLDVLWAAPTFDNLWGGTNSYAQSMAEPIGSWLINLWVFLMAAMVGAYLISYFASSSTVIYLLLRRKVDATDLDDVYVDEADEPVAPSVQVTPAAPAAEAVQTPAQPKPAETPVAEPKASEDTTKPPE